MRTKRPTPEPNPLSPLPPGTTAITRQGPSAVVYHIPTSPAAPSPDHPHLKTTISLPKHSTWTSGLHFHTSHTEYLRLVKGSIFVRLGTTTRVYSAAAGGEFHHSSPKPPGLTIQVPRGTLHDWSRAQKYYERRYIGVPCDQFTRDRDDEVVVEEWTDPIDIAKPLFFWNLNNLLLAPPLSPSELRAEPRMRRWLRFMLGGKWIDLQLFVIFWELDNWPVFSELATPGELDGWRAVKIAEGWGRVTSFLVLWVASLLGRMVGIEAVTEERTPEDLWEAWRREKGMIKEE